MEKKKTKDKILKNFKESKNKCQNNWGLRKEHSSKTKRI